MALVYTDRKGKKWPVKDNPGLHDLISPGMAGNSALRKLHDDIVQKPEPFAGINKTTYNNKGSLFFHDKVEEWLEIPVKNRPTPAEYLLKLKAGLVSDLQKYVIEVEFLKEPTGDGKKPPIKTLITVAKDTTKNYTTKFEEQKVFGPPFSEDKWKEAAAYVESLKVKYLNHILLPDPIPWPDIGFDLDEASQIYNAEYDIAAKDAPYDKIKGKIKSGYMKGEKMTGAQYEEWLHLMASAAVIDWASERPGFEGYAGEEWKAVQEKWQGDYKGCVVEMVGKSGNVAGIKCKKEEEKDIEPPPQPPGLKNTILPPWVNKTECEPYIDPKTNDICIHVSTNDPDGLMDWFALEKEHELEEIDGNQLLTYFAAKGLYLLYSYYDRDLNMYQSYLKNEEQFKKIIKNLNNRKYWYYDKNLALAGLLIRVPHEGWQKFAPPAPPMPELPRAKYTCVVNTKTYDVIVGALQVIMGYYQGLIEEQKEVVLKPPVDLNVEVKNMKAFKAKLKNHLKINGLEWRANKDDLIEIGFRENYTVQYIAINQESDDLDPIASEVRMQMIKDAATTEYMSFERMTTKGEISGSEVVALRIGESCLGDIFEDRTANALIKDSYFMILRFFATQSAIQDTSWQTFVALFIKTVPRVRISLRTKEAPHKETDTSKLDELIKQMDSKSEKTESQKAEEDVVIRKKEFKRGLAKRARGRKDTLGYIKDIENILDTMSGLDDVFQQFLHKYDLAGIVNELLRCLGLALSWDEILRLACEAVLDELEKTDGGQSLAIFMNSLDAASGAGGLMGSILANANALAGGVSELEQIHKKTQTAYAKAARAKAEASRAKMRTDSQTDLINNYSFRKEVLAAVKTSQWNSELESWAVEADKIGVDVEGAFGPVGEDYNYTEDGEPIEQALDDAVGTLTELEIVAGDAVIKQNAAAMSVPRISMGSSKKAKLQLLNAIDGLTDVQKDELCRHLIKKFKVAKDTIMALLGMLKFLLSGSISLKFDLFSSFSVSDIMGYIIMRAEQLLKQIITKLIAEAIRALLEALLFACKELQNDLANQALPDITLCEALGPQCEPIVAQIFQDHGIEPVQDMVEDIAVATSPIELCELLQGEASPATLKMIKNIIIAQYPQFEPYFYSKQKINDFFGEFAKYLQTEICEQIQAFPPEAVNDACLAAETAQIFKEGTPQEIKDILGPEKQRVRDRIKELQDLANKPLDIPDNCQLFPPNPAPMNFMLDMVLESVMGAVSMSYNSSIQGQKKSIAQGSIVGPSVTGGVVASGMGKATRKIGQAEEGDDMPSMKSGKTIEEVAMAAVRSSKYLLADYRAMLGEADTYNLRSFPPAESPNGKTYYDVGDTVQLRHTNTENPTWGVRVSSPHYVMQNPWTDVENESIIYQYNDENISEKDNIGKNKLQEDFGEYIDNRLGQNLWMEVGGIDKGTTAIIDSFFGRPNSSFPGGAQDKNDFYTKLNLCMFGEVGQLIQKSPLFLARNFNKLDFLPGPTRQEEIDGCGPKSSFLNEEQIMDMMRDRYKKLNQYACDPETSELITKGDRDPVVQVVLEGLTLAIIRTAITETFFKCLPFLTEFGSYDIFKEDIVSDFVAEWIRRSVENAGNTFHGLHEVDEVMEVIGDSAISLLEFRNRERGVFETTSEPMEAIHQLANEETYAMIKSLEDELSTAFGTHRVFRGIEQAYYMHNRSYKVHDIPYMYFNPYMTIVGDGGIFTGYEQDTMHFWVTEGNGTPADESIGEIPGSAMDIYMPGGHELYSELEKRNGKLILEKYMRLEGVKAPIKELMQTTIDYPGNPTPGQFTPEAINHAWGSFASMEWTHSKDFWQMALLHTFIEYPVGLTGADPTAPNSGPVKLTANAELIKQARRGHPRDSAWSQIAETKVLKKMGLNYRGVVSVQKLHEIFSAVPDNELKVDSGWGLCSGTNLGTYDIKQDWLTKIKFTDLFNTCDWGLRLVYVLPEQNQPAELRSSAKSGFLATDEWESSLWGQYVDNDISFLEKSYYTKFMWNSTEKFEKEMKNFSKARRVTGGGGTVDFWMNEEMLSMHMYQFLNKNTTWTTPRQAHHNINESNVGNIHYAIPLDAEEQPIHDLDFNDFYTYGFEAFTNPKTGYCHAKYPINTLMHAMFVDQDTLRAKLLSDHIPLRKIAAAMMLHSISHFDSHAAFVGKFDNTKSLIFSLLRNYAFGDEYTYRDEVTTQNPKDMSDAAKDKHGLGFEIPIIPGMPPNLAAIFMATPWEILKGIATLIEGWECPDGEKRGACIDGMKPNWKRGPAPWFGTNGAWTQLGQVVWALDLALNYDIEDAIDNYIEDLFPDSDAKDTKDDDCEDEPKLIAPPNKD